MIDINYRINDRKCKSNNVLVDFTAFEYCLSFHNWESPIHISVISFVISYIFNSKKLNNYKILR